MGEQVWSDDAGPIKDVWKDMPVVDAAGDDVGKVEFVRMGDPEAVTTQGQARPTGLIGDLVRLFRGGEPDAPRQVAENLIRLGFAKVDGKGLHRDVYVAADQIADVTDGMVRLSVGKDDLVAER